MAPERRTRNRPALPVTEQIAIIKTEHITPPSSPNLRKRKAAEPESPIPKKTRASTAEGDQFPTASPILTPPSTTHRRKPTSTESDLRAKKLKSYTQHASKSPFPDFQRPTPEECKSAHRILRSLHGARRRPSQVTAPTSRAGCGDSPSVLDALIRTILSQNTSDTNSSRAKRSMDRVYQRSDRWDAIVTGGREKLQEAIKCGGLSKVKSKVIIDVLQQVHDRYGEYSLDHLHDSPTDQAMEELLSFRGVGPKTASCVLLFCLGRESFAVDTHVWRITGLLGWRPAKASRDETHLHLDARIPDEDKYGLHVLLVSHGKKCHECRAGGKSSGKCELRKAFAKGLLKDDEAGVEPAKKEAEGVKEEGDYGVLLETC